MTIETITLIEIIDAIDETDMALNSRTPKPEGDRKKLLELRLKKLQRVKNMRIELIEGIAKSAQGD